MVAVLLKNDVFKIFKSFLFFYFLSFFFELIKQRKKGQKSFQFFFSKIFQDERLLFLKQKMYFYPCSFGHIFTSLPSINDFALAINSFQFISAPQKDGYRERNGKLQNLSESCLYVALHHTALHRFAPLCTAWTKPRRREALPQLRQSRKHSSCPVQCFNSVEGIHL